MEILQASPNRTVTVNSNVYEFTGRRQVKNQTVAVKNWRSDRLISYVGASPITG